MQLDNFNSAWRQLKLSNALQHIESNEILSIIENHGNAGGTRLQRVLFNVVVVIVITIVCQGG